MTISDDAESGECDRFHSSTYDRNVINCAKALVRNEADYGQRHRLVILWRSRLRSAVKALEAAERREKDRLSEMVSFTKALNRGKFSVSEISPGEHLFTRKPKAPR